MLFRNVINRSCKENSIPKKSSPNVKREKIIQKTPKHGILRLPDPTLISDPEFEEGQINQPCELNIKLRNEHAFSHNRKLSCPNIKIANISPILNKTPRCLMQKHKIDSILLDSCSTKGATPVDLNKKIYQFTPKIRSRRLSRQSSFKSTRTNRKSENEIIRSIANNMLQGYWEKKKEVEEKYEKMYNNLIIEENIESDFRISKYGTNCQNSQMGIKEIIENVRNEYNATRLLIMQQKIMELEDVINQYKQDVDENLL